MQPAAARGVAQAGRRSVVCHFRQHHRPGPPPVSRNGKHAPSSKDGKRQPAANRPPQQQPDSSSSSSSRRRNAPAAGTHAGPATWAQRMACIQGLMLRVQQQLQGGGSASSSSSSQLMARAEQHLELLMQLAEAEQRHITGDMPQEQLQRVLDDMQQQLQQERDALTGSSGADDGEAASDASSSSGSQLGAAERNELLGSNEALKQAVERASANLSSRQQGTGTPAVAAQQQQQQQQAAGGGARAEQAVPAAEATVEQLEGELQDTQAALQAAEAALQDSEALRMEYDVMCQQSFELSRKLSALQLERDELEQRLTDARARAVVASEELAEHRELQMQYDRQCQDMYRLRMMLQQAQAAGREASEAAAAAAARSKQDTAWLMESHRREVKEANQKQQELIEDAQQLRLRLLELQQQLWGQAQGPPPAAPAAAAASGEAAATAALEQQQEQQQAELDRLRQAGEVLVAEKQQVMRSLQEMQREQAVLLVELQQLRGEQARQQQQDEAAAAAAAAAPTQPSEAEQALLTRLEAAEQQRNTLVQQVQELQQRLQAREQAAAAAAAVAVAPTDATRAAAALAQLQDAKAQMVQLRGQLADTRRELAAVSGRAAAAEAALQQQAAGFEARLAQLQAWYGKQTVVLAALRRGQAPADGSVGFSNTNRFWVRQEQLFDFLKHWVGREALLQQQPGFLGLQVQPQAGVTPDGGMDVVVSSLWESIPLWEAWSKSDAARQQHMPTGVFQYVPAKGQGFPEDFVPFRDLEDAVAARY